MVRRRQAHLAEQLLIGRMLLRQGIDGSTTPLHELGGEGMGFQYRAQRVGHPQRPQFGGVRLVGFRNTCDGTAALLGYGDVWQMNLEEQGETFTGSGRMHGDAVGLIETNLEDGTTTKLNNRLIF